MTSRNGTRASVGAGSPAVPSTALARSGATRSRKALSVSPASAG